MELGHHPQWSHSVQVSVPAPCNEPMQEVRAIPALDLASG
jgi:hypothetical protein